MFKAIHAIVSVEELEEAIVPISSGIGVSLSGIIMICEDRVAEISGHIQYVETHPNMNNVPTLYGKISRIEWLSDAYSEINLWESKLSELYASV